MNKENRLIQIQVPEITEERIMYEEHEVKPTYIKSFDEISETDKEKVGGKAYNLSVLKKAGFPVPNGVVLTTDAHSYYKENGVLPNDLIAEVLQLKEKLNNKVALRSSATCEDSLDQSMAGVFSSEYVVDNERVIPALYGIYEQAQSDDAKFYLERNGVTEEVEMAVIEQELIVPEYSGVIYTGVNENNILIQYIDGFGSTLVDGETHGSALLVDKETGEIQESSDFEARPLEKKMVDQMITYAGKAKELFENIDQDIEFAIQGENIYILQSRPLTTEIENVTLGETVEETLQETKEKIKKIIEKEKQELGTETVVLSDSNFSELLPRPKEMDLGIFTYIFTGSDGVPGGIQLGRKEMGYKFDEKTVGYTQLIGGRPYFSLARDALTFYAGFPDTQEEYTKVLVSQYLQEVTDDPEKGKYPEMGLYLQDPTIEDLRDLFGNKAEAYFETYLSFKENMGGYAAEFLNDFYNKDLPQIEQFIEVNANESLQTLDNRELVDYSINILEHLRTASCVDFVKAARLGFYYSQRMQSDLKEKLGMSDEEAENAFVKLSQGLEGSKITEVNIAIDKADTLEEAYELGEKLVGHYSTSEMLEIRHARLKDEQTSLKAYVEGIRSSGNYSETFENQKKDREDFEQQLLGSLSTHDREELGNVIKSSQTYMSLRETVKYHFVREYALVRDALEELSTRIGLPEGDIYSLYPRELPNFINNPSEMKHIINARKRAFENFEQINMGPVIREEDVEKLNIIEEFNEEFVELHGKFLAAGENFNGYVVNIDEFENREELEKILDDFRDQEKKIILAATQMNLGHDPYISLASGMVIKNAGIASHGAQRAREMGRGAIGGINTKLLKTGMVLQFNPENRSIRKIILPYNEEQ